VPRRVRGDRAFKRIIDRLPAAVRSEIIVQLNILGRDVLAQERGAAPIKTGTMRDALSMRVLPASLKLKVGIIGKALNKRLFYSHVVQFGRKGGGRGIKRGSAKYLAGIGATKPRNFIYTKSRDEMYAPFREIWTRALNRASEGVSDD